MIYSCRYLRRPINIDVLYCTRRVARRLLSRIMTRFTARDPISAPLVPRLINRCKLNGTRLDFFARRSGETISLSAARIFGNAIFSRAAIYPLVPPEMAFTRLPCIGNSSLVHSFGQSVSLEILNVLLRSDTFTNEDLSFHRIERNGDREFKGCRFPTALSLNRETESQCLRQSDRSG